VVPQERPVQVPQALVQVPQALVQVRVSLLSAQAQGLQVQVQGPQALVQVPQVRVLLLSAQALQVQGPQASLLLAQALLEQGSQVPLFWQLQSTVWLARLAPPLWLRQNLFPLHPQAWLLWRPRRQVQRQQVQKSPQVSLQLAQP
jgi:hypothetical protein